MCIVVGAILVMGRWSRDCAWNGQILLYELNEKSGGVISNENNKVNGVVNEVEGKSLSI